MDDALLRYSCQVKLPGFGEAAQQRLQHAKVLVVGMGGLGCPAAQYLAASGIGVLGLADSDVISISNLHRQILYTEAEAGQKKVTIAAQKLQAQNPNISIITHDVRITSENVMDIISGYDIVADCTDNFETRYLLNDACVLTGKPLVYGAIYQYEGQVAVWNMQNDDGTYSPNYRDLFPNVDASQVPDCAEGGVLPTLAGIIGCMQANEVIKYITRTGALLAGKLLMFDAQTLQSRIIKTGVATKTQITALPQTVVVPVITADDLKTGMTANLYELVDVRSREERVAFNIGGSHIPLEEIANSRFEFNKPIVFYCASGKRSAEAVKMVLAKFPQADVHSLAGGLADF